jgi:hypothetical protein
LKNRGSSKNAFGEIILTSRGGQRGNWVGKRHCKRKSTFKNVTNMNYERKKSLMDTQTQLNVCLFKILKKWGDMVENIIVIGWHWRCKFILYCRCIFIFLKEENTASFI